MQRKKTARIAMEEDQHAPDRFRFDVSARVRVCNNVRNRMRDAVRDNMVTAWVTLCVTLCMLDTVLASMRDSVRESVRERNTCTRPLGRTHTHVGAGSTGP